MISFVAHLLEFLQDRRYPPKQMSRVPLNSSPVSCYCNGRLSSSHQRFIESFFSSVRRATRRGLAILAVLLIGFCSTGYSETLRIVVAGDDRADNDHNGFNKVITQEISDAVLKEKAEMLLWTGDLVNALKGDSTTFESELTAWRDAMKSLYDHGVLVLPVRGNHEFVGYNPKDSNHPEIETPHAEDIWNKVFSGRYALPTNGPDGEKNSVLIIGLDQYRNRHSVNQPWLDQVLKDNKRPFIFVYGHEPAFMAGNHKDEDVLAAEPSKRNVMWESLIGAGARVYFCGHDHFYDHMKIVRANGDPGPEMHQFTAGTAGAPFYKGGPYSTADQDWTRSQVAHIEEKPGYILIEIEGNKATITFKEQVSAGVYNAKDSYSYTAIAP